MNKAPQAECEKCPLAPYKHVNGKGPEQADLVIVGEAPGQQEIATGTPFTGKSGQLLNRVLEYHGIEREKVYVTNATLCRPPDNRTPTALEVRCCRKRLIAEIADRKPVTVLALGAVASKALVGGTVGIGKLRAVPDVSCAELPGVRILPTYHPAGALRNPDLFPSIIADVGKVKRVSVEWEHTKYKVAYTPEQALAFLTAQIDGFKELALDIEVAPPYDFRRPRWLSLAISHRPGAAIVYDAAVIHNPRFRWALRLALERPDRSWIFQNGKFDIKYLRSFAPNARVDADTMLAHYAVDERVGTHDLEQLAVEILGAPRYKADAKAAIPRGGTFADMPKDVLYQYNAGDADVTHRLMVQLRESMRSDGVEEMYHRLLIPGSNALAAAEIAGIEVDLDTLRELETSYTEQCDELELTLHGWVDNPRSPQQILVKLHELGYKVLDTRRETIQDIDDAFVHHLLRYKALHKQLSTYIRGLQRAAWGSRIYPTFLLHGTETGRLSCRNPNLQNITRGSVIRNAFIAKPGHKLVSLDYNAIEYRLMAHFSKDPWLLEQFNANRKLHHEVARQLFGDNYDERQYTLAKNINFTVIYGGGASTISSRYEVDVNTAQQLINAWYKRSPKVREYQRNIEQQIRDNSYLTSYFGRRRRFWLVTRDNWHEIIKQGYNFPIQSTASDLTLLSLVRLVPLLSGKAVPVVTVHDQLMFEVADAYVDEVAATAREVMETIEPFAVPTPVDVKIGERWGALE